MLDYKSLWLLSRDWNTYSDKFDIKTMQIFKNKYNCIKCYVGIKDTQLIICFRGTQVDAMKDIFYRKKVVPYNNMNSKVKVHGRIIKQYLSMRDEILLYIKNIYYNYDNILFIGHSLGGTLALLMILDYMYHLEEKWKLRFKESKAVIFGSPRIGNRYFKNSFTKRVKNVINIQHVNDIIPKLPLKIMGFRDLGEIIKIGKLRWQLPVSLKYHFNYYKYIKD